MYHYTSGSITLPENRRLNKHGKLQRIKKYITVISHNFSGIQRYAPTLSVMNNVYLILYDYVFLRIYTIYIYGFQHNLELDTISGWI